MNRRHFFRLSAAASGGVLFSVSLQRCDKGQKPIFDDYSENVEIGGFIHLTLENTVEVIIPKPEMGQRVRQALAMLVAEELDADWDKVVIRQGTLDPRLGDQTVVGSFSIIQYWEPMRLAGAATRRLLCEAAAKRWGLKRNMVTIENGIIRRLDETGETLEFGDVAMEMLPLTIPKKPRTKNPENYTLIGKTPVNKDIPALVNGTALFTNDSLGHHDRVAVVVRHPYLKGSLQTVPSLDLTKFPDVEKIIPLPARPAPTQTYPGVAVVATHTWAAMAAAKALNIKWNKESSENSDDFYRQVTASPEAKAIDVRGDAVTTLKGAAKTLEAEYQLPFLAHAPMEPMTCRVLFDPDRIDIEVPTQSPRGAVEAVSKQLKIPAEKIHITVNRMGGAFGRRANHDFVLEAAEIARQVHDPVTLVWTREDDMRFGFFRPASVHQLKAALAADGTPTAFQHHLYSSSISSTYSGFGHKNAHIHETQGSGLDLPYGIGHTRFLFSELRSDVRQGWWRAVAYSYNIFAIESFMDELAEAAGADPLAYRLKLLEGQENFKAKTYTDFPVEPARLKRVLEQVAEKADWGKTMPAGSGQGIAGCWYFTSRSYVAMVIEASVDENGKVRVSKVTVVIDCGVAVDPDGVRAQVEGCIVYGLSAALYGDITVKDGQIQESNFDDYPVLRFAEMPVVETHIVPSSAPPGGAGEPALPPVAPALCNAVFAATGKRVRRMPLMKHLS